MNILVTLNANYLGPLTVMIKSLMVNEPDENFDIYVAHSSLTEENFSTIKKVSDMSRTKIHSVEVAPELLADAPVMKRISKETYYRLLTNDILPESVQRILYIDPDTVIIHSIRDFYNIDFKGNILAAAGHTVGVVEWYNKKRLNMSKESEYINAGVLMINMDEMRQYCTTKDIFDFTEKNLKKLWLADQDVLNGFFYDKTLHVSAPKYNLDEKTFKIHKQISHLTLDWVRKNCSIIHYNGSQKPWKEDYKGVLSEFYFIYKALADDDLKK